MPSIKTLLLTLIFSAWLTHSHANELLVAIEDYNYPPRYFFSESGEPQGIEVDLVEAIASKLKLVTKIIKCPWNRCLIMMQEGQVDVMPYLLKRPEREQYMHFIDPPYQLNSEKCFFAKKETQIQIRKYEDLSRFTIGVAKGAAYFPRFDKDVTLKKVEVISEENLFPMLLRDRFDTFVGACQPLSYIALKSKINRLVKPASYIFSEPNPAYLAISKKSNLLSRASEFETALSIIISTGEFDNIKKSYLEED